MTALRDQLRALKSLPGPYAPFDLAGAPATPEALFGEWLAAAIAAAPPRAAALSPRRRGVDDGAAVALSG